MNSIINFFKGTYAEMKHVVWPTKKRAVIYALIVIIFSVALGYLLFGFDSLFRAILNSVIY